MNLIQTFTEKPAIEHHLKKKLEEKRREQLGKYIGKSKSEELLHVNSGENKVIVSDSIHLTAKCLAHYPVIKICMISGETLAKCSFSDNSHAIWEVHENLRCLGLGGLVRTAFEAVHILDSESAQTLTYIKGLINRGYVTKNQNSVESRVSQVNVANSWNRLNYPRVLNFKLDYEKALKWEPKSYDIDWNCIC